MKSFECKEIIEQAKNLGKEVLTEEQLIALGYILAIENFGIWKNGEQTIGCLGKRVREIRKEIKKEFFF